MKRMKRLLIIVMIFACVFGVFALKTNVYAYENMCRAYSIGIEGGEFRDETVCVYVDENGKAHEIQMRNNSLKYYYDAEGTANPSYVCLNVKNAGIPLTQGFTEENVGAFGWYQLAFEDDCIGLAAMANGLPDDPDRILDRTEELLRKTGRDWNGSILTGDVKARNVSSLNSTYENPSGTVVADIDCDTVGGEPNSSGGCKNTERDACDGQGGEWYENLSDAIRHDPSLKAGLGTCYMTAAADSNSNGALNDGCLNGGAGALGWFVCPIIEWLSNSAEYLYESVEPYLQISPKLFNDQNSSIEQAWGSFRDVANILFAILLLIVIISQITGFGIDNYGIKKILPKMIISAILINLSYVICLVFIDLSNIVGNGFRALFDGMSSGLNPTISIEGSSTVLASTVIPAASLLAFVATIGAVIANPAMLLSLLVSAISVVFGLFFLFILLVAREATIIVLVTVSPLAVVCYMLPNTKKVFDRWLSIFKGLLLLYPICGLLVGGGSYISKLLLSVGFGATGGPTGFVRAFASMMVGIAPVFFIPMVLKNSLAAMGNIGAKISGLGSNLGKMTTGAIRNTDSYKNAQEAGLKRANRIKAGMDKHGNLTFAGRQKAKLAGTKWGRRLGYEAGLARGASQARKNIAEQESAGAILTGALAQSAISHAENLNAESGGILGDGFKAKTEGAYYGREFLDAANAGDITRMNSVIQAMNNSNMKPKDVAKLIRFAESSGAIRIKDSDAAADWRGKMFSQYGNGFLSTDAELSHRMMTRGMAGDIDMNYGDYAARFMGIDDIKPEDIPKLSGESLAGMVSSGHLTQGMAQRVLANNPNISEDKKIMISAVATGKASGGIDPMQFKEDANELMKNHGANVKTISTNGDSALVDAWVASNPREVNVVQNFTAGGDQLRSVDVNLRRPKGQ